LKNRGDYRPWGLIAAPIFALFGLLFVGGGSFGFLYFLLTWVLAPYFMLYGLSAWLCRHDGLIGKAAFAMRRVLQGGVVCGLMLCIVAQGFILANMSGTRNQEADILLVLGAGLRDGQYPSGILAVRLDFAIDYMNRHPNVSAVVTGGLGANALVTEAEAMYAYMVARGIDSSRVMIEDRSTTTGENIRFSAEFLDGAGRIGIVSNDFHLYRARFLAQRAGYDDIALISVPTWNRNQRIIMHIRETGSVIFAWLGRN